MELHTTYRWNAKKKEEDKSWLEMFFYVSKDYKTKKLRQIEKIKNVLAVKLWLRLYKLANLVHSILQDNRI